MASHSLPISFTKEATNYARLCRLLIEVGSQVLREKDDDIRDQLKSIDDKTEKTHELLLDLKDHVVSLGGIPGRSIKLCN